VVPSWFKRLQMRSKKQKQKERDCELFENPKSEPEAKFKKIAPVGMVLSIPGVNQL
jgi:hypothetical protein